jgi:plastocyanin
MGTRLVLAAVSAALVAAVAPALAATDHTVTASNYTFTMADITIAPGDRVVFANSGGMHNFAFDDGPQFPADPTASGMWPADLSRTFTVPGTYPYHCELHAGLGMRGTITVSGGGSDPAPTPTPAPTPSPGPSGGAPPPPGGAGAVRVRSLAPAARSFCVRRGPACRRPGVRLDIDLSGAARVSGVLRRRARRFGQVDFGTVPAGPRTLRFQRTSAGKRLSAGRYTLAVAVSGASTTTVRFRVR